MIKLKNKILIIFLFFAILFLLNIKPVQATSYEFNFTYNDEEYTVYTPDTDYTNFTVFYGSASTSTYFYLLCYNSDTVLAGYLFSSNTYSIKALSVDDLSTLMTFGYCDLYNVSGNILDFSSKSLLTSSTMSTNPLTFVYSTSNIYDYNDLETVVFQGANRNGLTVRDTGNDTGSSEDDDGSSDDSDSGWLDNLWNWFTNLLGAILDIAGSVGDVISSIFEPIFTFFENIGDGLVTLVTEYLNPFSDNFFVYKLIDLLKSALKELFVPDDNYFTDKLDTYSTELNEKIPYQDYLNVLYDTEDYISSDDDSLNISIDLNNYKLMDKMTLSISKFINFSIFSKYKDTWYAWVRVFIYIAVVIYNLNEIIKFLRGFNLINGAGKEPGTTNNAKNSNAGG